MARATLVLKTLICGLSKIQVQRGVLNLATWPVSDAAQDIRTGKAGRGLNSVLVSVAGSPIPEFTVLDIEREKRENMSSEIMTKYKENTVYLPSKL